ncbi:sugar transferase [Algibacter mikhailovii]|uniref:sugar transferase n=1 Tax=Algibacter mikhailovii TaxID=425498 RepID=UPI0024950CEC|nr:sugar transferase [Algibacter mikhailovii]
MNNPAPILLFTYKRLEPLIITIEALKKNNLASESDLFIFSDGPKKKEDESSIDEIRMFLKTIDGFKRIEIIESPYNQGLANSIIGGVTKVMKRYNKVIVLEDDLKTSTNFLDFMNKSLDYYENNKKIMSISGYTPPIVTPEGYTYDNYFTQRASSWGWATYKSQWEKVDWSVSGYNDFKKNFKAKRKFNKMGSDMAFMLSKQMNKAIDSWAIRWCYHQFKNDLYTVFPISSKIDNIGFAEGATHTKGNSEILRFASPIDNSKYSEFNFKDVIVLDSSFIKQFVVPYSMKTRIKYKLKGIFGL